MLTSSAHRRGGRKKREGKPMSKQGGREDFVHQVAGQSVTPKQLGGIIVRKKFSYKISCILKLQSYLVSFYWK